MTADGQPAMYRSRDAGDTWERLTVGLPSNSWTTVLRQAMAVDPLDTAGVYAGTTGGAIFYSSDEGDTWQSMDCQLPRIQGLGAVVLD